MRAHVTRVSQPFRARSGSAGFPVTVCTAGSYCAAGAQAPTGRVPLRRHGGWGELQIVANVGPRCETVCARCGPPACATAGYYCPSGTSSATQYRMYRAVEGCQRRWKAWDSRAPGLANSARRHSSHLLSVHGGQLLPRWRLGVDP